MNRCFSLGGSLPSSTQTKEDYLDELEKWKKKGAEEKYIDEAVSTIKAFIKDPEKVRLSFDGCRLKTPPPLSFIAHRIEWLFLRGNKLTSLPEFFKEFVNLKHLDLRGNNLTTLPECILELKKLEFLSLEENENLEEIPPGLLDDPNLDLRLHDTKIKGNLKVLRLRRRNDRSCIAADLLFKVKKQLSPSLPEVVENNITGILCNGYSIYLKELEEWENKGGPGNKITAIERINSFINNSENVLYLDDLGLLELPPLDFIQREIKILSLIGNPFETLPDSFEGFIKLEKLYVTWNQLRRFQHLREKLPSFTHLEIL